MVNNNIRVLDLNDQGYYFVKTNNEIVYVATKKGEEGKFECCYWIYMNSKCYRE